MAEAAAKVEKLPPLPAQSVARKGSDGNDISIELSTFQIVKGDNAGKQYLAPKITVENLDQMIEWHGRGNVVNILQTFDKRTFWSIWVDAIMPDGTFNMVKFLKEAADFTSTGMKLKEIREKMAEVQAELSLLIRDGDISTTIVVNPDGSKTKVKSADLLKIDKLNDEFLAYKDMEEKKARPGKAETADEPAVVTS